MIDVQEFETCECCGMDKVVSMENVGPICLDCGWIQDEPDDTGDEGFFGYER